MPPKRAKAPEKFEDEDEISSDEAEFEDENKEDEEVRSEEEPNEEVEEEDQESIPEEELKDTAKPEQDDSQPAKGHKRKKSTAAEEPNKAAKKEDPNNTHSKPSQRQTLQFLISDAATTICRPEEEAKEVADKGDDFVTYATLLSPFEELLCAVILSRPISHRLGLRTIRTILNQPYSFRDPETIKKAGSEKVHQALWDARTQHKDKTADEIELIADAVNDNDWSSDLEKLREKAGEKVEEEREMLRKNIKGLGKTGLDIFYRRVQWTWTEAYPFVDDRTKASVEKLGLPGDAEGLVQLIKENWDDIGFSENGSGKEDADEKKRRAFVIVLERAVGGDLEKKTGEMLEEAIKS